VVRGEPADAVRQSRFCKEFLAENAVTNVVLLVEVPVGVVERVHPDVVQQRAGPNEFLVDLQAWLAGNELAGEFGNDQAMRVNGAESLRRRRVLLVQRADLVISRYAHGTEPSGRPIRATPGTD
jgi:hypothetical protein